jgi:hypothetical protein
VLFEGARREEVFHCGEQGIFMLSYVSICVSACYAMLLYIRPDTLTLQRAGHIHALVCENLCVCMLLYIRPDTLSLRPTTILLLSLLLCVCPRTTTYVSAYYYTCVLILLRMCPHTQVHARGSKGQLDIAPPPANTFGKIRTWCVRFTHFFF